MGILGRQKNKVEESTSRVLDISASMQGSLVFQEPVSLRINGRFQGSLETRGDLTIGEQADVRADITGEAITIAGRVTGKVVAKRLLRIVPPAVVVGEVWAPLLEVQEGARLEGSVHMSESGSWMTADEVAEYLEVEIRVVAQWAREGKIPAVEEQGQWQFEKAKIDDWVASQRSS